MYVLTRNELGASQFCAVATSVGRAVKIARQYLVHEKRQFASYEIREVQINWPEDWAEGNDKRFEGPLQRMPLVVVRKIDRSANAVSLFFPRINLHHTHNFSGPSSQITVN